MCAIYKCNIEKKEFEV